MLTNSFIGRKNEHKKCSQFQINILQAVCFNVSDILVVIKWMITMLTCAMANGGVSIKIT